MDLERAVEEQPPPKKKKLLPKKPTVRETLPDDREYLLYCDQGVMSRMQALHLADRGLDHFGVYRRTGTDS